MMVQRIDLHSVEQCLLGQPVAAQKLVYYPEMPEAGGMVGVDRQSVLVAALSLDQLTLALVHLPLHEHDLVVHGENGGRLLYALRRLARLLQLQVQARCGQPAVDLVGPGLLGARLKEDEVHIGLE